MIVLSNIHTHTQFCDGRESMEAIVKSAITNGFASLGFSPHSYTDFDSSFCMSLDGTEEYFKEIERLREMLGEKIEIYRGCERDYFSNADERKYDFVIGSLHYVVKNGEYLSVDESEDVMVQNVCAHYGGDYIKYIKDYYELESKVAIKTKPDVIGHFDVVTKFNEDGKYFDENSAEYKRAAIEALEELRKHCDLFEMNSGAIYRGSRRTPYPSMFLLKEMKRLGCRIILSSDSHDKASLGCFFGQMMQMAKECGFRELVQLTGGKFREVGIEEVKEV